MISDNNLSFCNFDHVKNVLEYLEKKKKIVTFNNGLNCRSITVDIAKLLKKPKYNDCGLRLSFDRIEDDGIFQNSINMLKNNGIAERSLMIYVLFNFTETPQEANYRFEECRKLGVKPYPQNFMPLDKLDKKERHVGKCWTENLLLAFKYFWFSYDRYREQTFDQFVKNNDVYKFNEEDLEKWYYKKG